MSQFSIVGQWPFGIIKVTQTGPMALDLRVLEETAKQVEMARVEYQELLEKRGQIFFQQRECEMVLEEFEFLNETDVVMKKNGPILVKQDLEDAKSEIQNTVSIIKTQLQNCEKELEEKQKTLLQAETKLQELQSKVK